MNYHEPICIDKFNIYDVLHNDDNELIIISPYIPDPYTIKYISIENEVFILNLYKCPGNHTFIYRLKVEYVQHMKLSINDSIIETFVKKYPSFKDEIIYSTIVENEDDFILPWINYHLRLGVSRFIIYDNSNNYTLSTILDEHITPFYISNADFYIVSII